MAATIKITTLAQLKVALQAAKTYIDGQIGGLGTMAGKSEVAYDDLAAALKTLIDGKAAQATVDTLVGEDTGKDTIQASDVISHLCGTRGVTQNPVSDLLQGIVRLVSTSHDLCDFLRRDSAYR